MTDTQLKRLDERNSDAEDADVREEHDVSARAATGEAPPEPPDAPTELPQASRSRWMRRGLFLLLPVALIGGGYWYVTGGQVTSMDDAYVEADKVGVSTDISGTVKQVDVTENQHVEAGQVLFLLDDLPFRLALARAEA